jgi:putative two-component system response regulator
MSEESDRPAILIVDDESAVRAVLTRILEPHGYSCAQAASAEEARIALRARAYDLVLCDVNMPGESGLDLVKQMLQMFPSTAVIMVTGVDDPAVANLALEYGATGYVVKPFTSNVVLINVANALHRRRLEAENNQHREQLVEAVRDRTAELWQTIRRVETTDVRLREAIVEMMQRLSLAAELRDKETANHIERMSRYSEILARKVGFDDEYCAQMFLAARLHDAGKISIPDRVLRKKGKYTPADFEIMKEHSQIGHDLLAGSEAELLGLASIIAWTHHERFDGSGYPRRLADDEIPVPGRIAAIADVFDALLSRRSYKPAYPVPQAIDIMKEGRGTHFDPDLLDVFVDSMDAVLAVTQDYAD